MSQRKFKDEIYPHFARVAQALASDKRLELLDILTQGPRHVDALAQETGMSVANSSQHLQTLRAARLVETARKGNMIIYRVADPSVMNLWVALRGVAESRLAEVKQLAEEFHSARSNGDVVTRDQAEVLAHQNAVLLDVRPVAEFEELPSERRIIAYCRGLYCLLADEAAALLLANGFDVVRLEGGWPEWQSEGRPVIGGVT